MEFEAGKILNDRYRLESIIAKGGMGSIYLATDLNLSIKVAVKENLFTSDAYIRQFQREANMLAMLKHVNLPRVTEHFILPGIGQYLVMDFIEGEDIRQRLKRSGALSEQEVLFIGVSICDTLHYLHSRIPPIVHRDIKPGNIKITPKGDIVLVDFGLAKMFTVGKVTTVGAQSLTPGYAPPEQYGQGTEPRTDIYALGATMYAALTNAIPEDGISRAMGTHQLTPIQTYNPTISNRLTTCINKAMAVEIKDRYENAIEFKESLQQADRSTLTLTKPITELRLTPPPAKTIMNSRTKEKKKRKIWSILGVVATLIIFFSLLFIFLPGIFSNLVNQMIHNTEITMMPLGTQTKFVSGSTSTLNQAMAVTPSESGEIISSPTITLPSSSIPIGGGSGEVAFASVLENLSQIFLMDLDGTNKIQLTNIKGGACQPAWSPDGQKLVFTSPCTADLDIYENSSLYIMDLQNDVITPLPSVPGGDFDPSWSSVGDKIAFATLRDGNKSHIYVLDLELGANPARVSPIITYDRSPSWSPDDRKIAFVSSRDGFQQIWLMNPDGSDATEFSLSSTDATDEPTWSPDGKFIIYSMGSINAAILATRSTIRFDAAEIELNHTFFPAHKPVISMDGLWLLCESNGEIYRLDIDGNNPINLTNSISLDFDPAIRP